MINQSDEWVFIKRPSRPALSNQDVTYWKEALQKLLKVGVEIELNLPEKSGSCDRQNFMCKCTSIFTPLKKMPSTQACYEQCLNWNDGECDIAKEHGCAGVYCVSFATPCPGCNKYDRGCSKCPELYDLRKDPRHVRESIGKILKPTRFVGAHGSHGVYKVCKDGSLLGDGGVEIATVGKRVQFFPLYDMLSHITKLCDKYGAYVDERCSIHVHLLASYLTPGFSGNDKGGEFLQQPISEMEQSLPEVVLANFHQLVRRYHCALIWLSSAGESMNHFTRWEKFRKSVLPFSTLQRKMSVVTQEVNKASKSKRKYAMMNYEQLQFDEHGDVSQLHVEARYMDGNICPSVITAHACLVYGMMLKAVELSRYGVLQSGTPEYMEQQKEMYNCLCNGDGPWDGSRFSDTSNIGPYVKTLREQATQLVRLVKSTLTEHTPADEILRSLAETPLTYHRIKGKSWEEIEDMFIRREPQGNNELDNSMMRIIAVGAVAECEDTEEWVHTVTQQIATEREVGDDGEKTKELREQVRTLVDSKLDNRSVFWSREIGGYLRAR